MSVDPWTVYWQGDHLQSCIASESPEDSDAIAVFWEEFACVLGDDSTVLDLACGNGAIPQILLTTNSSLEICAVDKASIAPQRFLSNFGELSKVKFLPETDICDLPFDPESFDAVTSQFGLEYAPLTKACQSAAGVLKKRGSIRLLMHHEDSEILQPVKANLAEIGRLLHHDGVFSGIESYLSKDIDLQQLEVIGRQYLNSEALKTPQVSGQIFAGVNKIIDEMTSDETNANLLMTTMKTRLLADQSRLQQLTAAALNVESYTEIQQALQESCITIEFFKPLLISTKDATGNPSEALIGWQLAGTKQ
jgi:ubiquinone/menaquinone biosynthesis C-methylase UbiE